MQLIVRAHQVGGGQQHVAAVDNLVVIKLAAHGGNALALFYFHAVGGGIAFGDKQQGSPSGSQQYQHNQQPFNGFFQHGVFFKV